MFRRIPTATIALMICAAIVAPTAMAQPIDAPLPDVQSTAAQPQHSDPYSSFETSKRVAGAVQASDSGFDWGDAGIGAAVIVGLLSAGAGAVLVGRRSRDRKRPATASGATSPKTSLS
jgi:hypothetical protein